MKKVLTATCALRDRYIVSIERLYTPSTFYMKSAVVNKEDMVCYEIVYFLYDFKLPKLDISFFIGQGQLHHSLSNERQDKPVLAAYI